MACGAGTGVFLLIRVWTLLTFTSLLLGSPINSVLFQVYLFVVRLCLLFGEVTKNSLCDYRKLQFCYKDAHARLLGHLRTWMHLVKR